MSDQVKIAIFGAGAIGSAVYDLLRDRTTYSVTVADMRDYKAVSYTHLTLPTKA